LKWFVTWIATLRRPPRIILGSGWRTAPCAPIVSARRRFAANASAAITVTVSSAVATNFPAAITASVAAAFATTAFAAAIFTTSSPAAHAAAAATSAGVAVATVAHRSLLGSGAFLDFAVALALLLCRALEHLHFLAVLFGFLDYVENFSNFSVGQNLLNVIWVEITLREYSLVKHF
jgi:hypothetical protein